MQSLQGHLLIAAPELLDPNFARTIVLIVRHQQSEGALGLVLNQPTNTSVREAWEQVSELPCHYDGQLYRGGPCEGPLTALHADELLLDVEVLPDVYASIQANHIEQLVAEDHSPIRFFAGTAGWAPGQLETELAEGSWLLAPATADLVFNTDERLWEKVQRKISGDAIISALGIKHIPDDPSSN